MIESDSTPEETLARNLRRIKTEGLDAATNAALQLLRDPKAPAQAKSATINAMYRASGLFGRTEEDTIPELHEMTSTQLNREIRKLQRNFETAGEAPTPGQQGDVFK
jgi:hypothetical protein